MTWSDIWIKKHVRRVEFMLAGIWGTLLTIVVLLAVLVVH